MICESCSREFFEDWRRDIHLVRKQPIPRFCSKSCAHRRIQTTRMNEARSQKLRGIKKSEASHILTPEESARGRANGRMKRQAFVEARRIRRIHVIENILENGGSRQQIKGFLTIFRQIVIEKLGNVCGECGIGPEWNGKPLSFQVHHKDGDVNHNKLKDLKILCPNCHTQTETWGSKNYNKSTREYKLSFR